MAKLSTHILDTANGCPAQGVGVTLYRIDVAVRVALKQATTNADGRTDGPLLEGDSLLAGAYELDFAIGDYFSVSSEQRFLDVVTVRFTVQAGVSYHVPLLASPFGYTTYRGS